MGFSEWKEVVLKDVIQFNPKETIKKGTVAKKIGMDKLNPFQRNVEGYELEEYKSGSKFRNGDTLLARITPCLENGKTAQVRILNDKEIGFGSTEFFVLREKQGITINDYIYYLAISPGLRNIAIKSMTGTSGRQRAQKDVIENSVVKLPPIEEQKAIANILSTLDEKIEVNNRINKTLEEMAQAIFKHWFVDFEFPNENGEPYKSSGGEMVESELGMIPKKWEIVEIGELCKAQIGGDWGKDERFINSVPAVCLRGTDLQKLKELGFSREAPIRWVKKNSIEKRRISELDILIGGSGLGPVGRSLCYSNNFERLYDYPITYSNFCKRIRAINRPMAIYLEQIIEGLHKTNEIKHYVNGTSVPNLDIKGLLKHKIIKPDNEVIEAFSVIKENYFNYKYSKENLILSQIRNTLLPKLMSGEIRVPIKSGSEIS
jgi:type I restriction enzyme S subunit